MNNHQESHSAVGSLTLSCRNIRRLLLLWAALSVELVASFFLQLPAVYNLANFVFYDAGSALCADWLVAQGYTPTVDFGYPYGLLSLLTGHAWFALCGRTPGAFLAFTLLTEIVMALGLARLAARWNRLSIAFLLLALPQCVMPIYLDLTHPLEAALLLHAIADLSTGRRARALMLVAICLFIKPSMAYFLGLLLVVSLLCVFRREQPAAGALVHSFLPAAIAVLSCAITIAVFFGLAPLVNSVLPLTGLRSYQALDFGFFGNGRLFWLPQLEGVRDYADYYLTGTAGFWLVCTVLLALFGALSIAKLWGRFVSEYETLLVIAACHLFFIFVLYAWPGSWTYYAYLLPLGVGAGLATYRPRARWALPLLALTIICYTQLYQGTLNAWQWMERSADTDGLWAYEQQREEWRRVRDLAAQRPLLFLHHGCASLLFPEVRGPLSHFLSPSVQTPTEIKSIRQQIEQVEVIVTFNHAPILDAWNWTEFADQRAHFVTIWYGSYLTIHERKRQ
jgi:hypothetical protein